MKTGAAGEIDRPACLEAFLARTFAPGTQVVAVEAAQGEAAPPRELAHGGSLALVPCQPRHRRALPRCDLKRGC